MIRSILFLILALPVAATAQFSYLVDQRIPVADVGGNTLSLPWAGGLNAAQYNTMDLNNDGKDDLILFDRTANKVITYVNENNQYVYAGDYERFFPSEITNWILLRDFNCDGRKDIFTGDIGGIRIFINTMPAEGLPSWEHFLFYASDGTPSDVVLTTGFQGKINLQIQYDDLPAIADMDGDGDLDIMNVQYFGDGTLEYHENIGTCDLPDFKRVTREWGNFRECDCGNYAFNGQDCPTGGRISHAGGKSLLTLDLDDDSDLDLLFSESSCTQLYKLTNTGTNLNPAITSSSAFPALNPVNFQIFPAAFYEDVDFDNKKDLIVTPNIYVNDFPASSPRLRQSNWFYKNTGTDTQPSFVFVRTNFMQDQMIDVGDNAVPAFADYDADGDLDMFISQLTTENNVASIYLYKNTGTGSEPEFKLETIDFVGFSGLGLFNVKLQWVDITGDGKTDMVFTGTSFQNGITSLYYVANKSTTDAFVFYGQNVETTGFTVQRSENIYVTDVDQNGTQDLLVGKANGSLEYWKNNAPKGSFDFLLEDDTYLNLEISLVSQNPRCVTADLDGDGKEDLILGDQSGMLRIISNYRETANVSGAVTDIVFNELLKGYASPNFGGRIWPEVANIFNSDKPAIIVGNIMGGVQVLRHDGGLSLNDDPVVFVYPVPVRRTETLHIRVDRPSTMEIYSSLGQRISDPVSFNANVINDFQLPFLSSGVYMLKFRANNKSVVKRIVIY